MTTLEKIYVIVDKDGVPMDTAKTRASARKFKKDEEYWDTIGPEDARGPFRIIQYKRWKKVR